MTGNEPSVRHQELKTVAETLNRIVQEPMPMLPNPDQLTKAGTRTWFDVRCTLPNGKRRIYAVCVVTNMLEEELKDDPDPMR